MPVLLKDFRNEEYNKRITVYTKIKSIVSNGYITSSEFLTPMFTENLGFFNDIRGKDYLSSQCNDLIYSQALNLFVATGSIWSTDKRETVSGLIWSQEGFVWNYSGDVWEPIDSTFNGGGTSLIESNNTLFCGGIGGPVSNRQVLKTSTDGKTWQNLACPITGNIQQLATDGIGNIIAVGRSSAGQVVVASSSTNGTTWNSIPEFAAATTATIQNVLLSVVYDNSISNYVFYICAYQPSGGNFILRSTDNSTWTDITGNFPSTPTGNFTKLKLLNNTYILCVGISFTDPVYYSTDGVSWSASTGISQSIFGTTDVTSDGSSLYLSVQYPSSTTDFTNAVDLVYKSSDGSVWTPYMDSYQIQNLQGDLTSNKISGIDNIEFYVDSLYMTGSFNGIDYLNSSYFPFGLIQLRLSDWNQSSKPQILNGQKCTKLLIADGAFLVSVAEGGSSDLNDNTIYYYTSNGSLAKTY